MKQLFIILCFLVLASCNHKPETTDDVSPKEVCIWENGDWTTDWMRLYVDYARGYDKFYTDKRIMDIWRRWTLAHIDNDTIPEMVFLCAGEAYGNKVLTIHNGQVVEWNSWRCGSSYIPKSGLIENHDGSMGYYYDRVFRLENGVFTEIFNHTDEYYCLHDTITETMEYFCHFKGDSILRIGFDQECGAYHRLKDSIYFSVGESIKFDAINDYLSTDLFNPDFHPTSRGQLCTSVF